MNCQNYIINLKQSKGEKKMINFNKNELINKTLDKYYETFSHTLDTTDFVPEKFNLRISKYIFKNMKKAFKRIDKEDRKYQKEFNKKVRKKIRDKKKAEKKLNPKQNWLKKLFSKRQRTLKAADSNDNS